MRHRGMDRPDRHLRMLRAALWLLALLLVSDVGTAHADSAQPAYLQLEETAPRRFAISWRVPWHQGRILSMRPELPEDFVPVGPRTRDVTRSGLQETWQVQAPPWTGAREEIRIVGIGAAVAETFLQVRFLDGSSATRVLSPGAPSCDLPRPLARGGEDATAWPTILAHATRAGLSHVRDGWLHILFVCSVLLCWPGRRSFVALGALLAGQCAGVALHALVGLDLPSPPVEALFGVSAALLAAAALRERRPGPWPIPLVLGLLHGAALAGAFAAPPPGQVAFVLGMDAGHVVVCLLGVILLGPRLRARVPRPVAYVVGTLAVALACLALQAGEQAQARPRYRAHLSTLALPDTQPEGPSQALGVRSTAPVQAFLEWEGARLRVEVLLAATALPGGLPGGAAIPVEAQPAVKTRAGLWAQSLLSVQAEQETLPLVVDTTYFVTTGPAGVLERPTPVEEPILEARIGVSLSAAVPEAMRAGGMQELRVERVEVPDDLDIPLTVVEQGGVRTALLSVEEPDFRWSPRTPQRPQVQSVVNEGAHLPLPLVSVGLLLLALVVGVRRLRTGQGSPGAVRIRMLCALAAGLAATALVPVPLPAGGAPEPARAEAIAEALVANVYRALSEREESEVYDRLAVTVDGPLRSQIYLDQRKTLDLEGRGGARARVESVEVTDLENLKEIDDGFTANVTWSAAGSVVHFGHRHLRRNSYRARLEIVDRDGSWRLRALEILELERTR